VSAALSVSEVSAAEVFAVSVCMLVTAAATPIGKAAEATTAAADPAAAARIARRERSAFGSEAM
jgi:hypothetical protein